MENRPNSSSAQLPTKATAQQKGFALIATVAIMVLLVLVVIGMLSLSRSEVKKSKLGEHQTIARANARMALTIALGQLQESAGPDTRVTANVSVLEPNSPNPHWVQVFKTRPDEDLEASTPVSGRFVTDHHQDPRYLTDNRTSNSSTAITNLISGHDTHTPDTQLTQDNSVALLDTGDTDTSVRAPLVSINDSRYAYWVSDNSTKALYNQASPYTNQGSNSPTASAEEYYESSVAQGANLDQLEIDNAQPTSGHSSTDKEVLDKASSIASSQLIFSSLENQTLKKAFHTITADSASVFSNTITGGLKHDMTGFLEHGDMSPSGSNTGRNLPSFNTQTPIIKGDHHNMTSPKYGIFKNWADLRFQLSDVSGAASIPAQVPPNTHQQAFPGYFPLQRRDLTQHTGSYIQPVVVEASLGWDFSPYAIGGTERLRAHIFPRLILWNPYNVEIEATQYVFMAKTPIYGTFGYRGTGQFSGWGFEFNIMLNMRPSSHPNGAHALPMFVTRPTTIPPGECRVFTPDTGSPAGGQPYDVSNFGANFLSADNAPGANNFYADTTLELTVPATAANAHDPYGFSNSGGHFHSNWERGADEYIVLQHTGGTLPANVTHASVSASSNFQTIAHFVAQNNVQTKWAKWYAAENSQNAINGNTDFIPMDSWAADRLPPRLWRRGVRLQWYDESSELASSPHYPPNPSRLTTPLLTSTNILAGTTNHPSPLDVRFQPGGWQVPFLNGHLYFNQPTDPEELRSFFPPSPIGRPSDGYPTQVTLFDIPRQNPGIFSLGQFQSAQFSLHPWHPTSILGNGYSTRQAELDSTVLHTNSTAGGQPTFNALDSNRWGSSNSTWGNGAYVADDIIQRTSADSSNTHGDEILIYDIAFELNHAIWDHFFVSGIPHSGAANSRSSTWNATDPLPVASYKARSTKDYTIDEIPNRLQNSQFAFYNSAEFLLNHGALNINCDNVEVWKAFLFSLKNKQRPNLDGESLESDTTSFSAQILSKEAGDSSISSTLDSKAWNAYRSLSDEEVEELATRIVEQVRLRGPFMSLSDMVNRRLSTDQNLSRKGALQAAIDETSINADLQTSSSSITDGDEVSDTSVHIPSISNRADYKSAMLPGYLSQQDLLTVLSPSMTARGDTFTVRTYGDSRDANGKVKAVAYCEAVVQRVPEYVDPTDSANEPLRTYNTSSEEWELNTASGGDEGLSATNIRLGRKFVVTKFRWLTPSEI